MKLVMAKDFRIYWRSSALIVTFPS